MSECNARITGAHTVPVKTHISTASRSFAGYIVFALCEVLR
jgi:hypothetical protein